MKNTFKRAALAAASSLVLLGVSGQASAELIKEVGLSNGLYVNSLTLPVSGAAQNYFSGLQILKVDADNVLAFCIDPYQWSPSSSVNYTRRTDFAVYFGARAAAIDALYSNFYAGTLPGESNGNKNAAGFQLALWELVADNAILNSGVVRTNSSTNAIVKNSAQAILNALPNASAHDLYDYTIYTNAAKQDYLVVSLRPSQNETPEPESALLVLAGLAVLSWRRYH